MNVVIELTLRHVNRSALEGLRIAFHRQDRPTCKTQNDPNSFS